MSLGRPGNDPEDEDEDRDDEEESPSRVAWGNMWEAWANRLEAALERYDRYVAATQNAEQDDPPPKRGRQND